MSTFDKQAARQCLLAADRFLKETKIIEARREVERARELDPGNVYIQAFVKRIKEFESSKVKNDTSSFKPIIEQSTDLENDTHEKASRGKEKKQSTQQDDATYQDLIEQRHRELEALAMAEEQRRLMVEARLHELEAIAAEEEQKRKEIEQQALAEKEKRLEAEKKAAELEEKSREAFIKVQEETALRHELEESTRKQIFEIQKGVEKTEEELRKKSEAHKEEEEKRKQLEVSAIAEELRHKEYEARVEEEHRKVAEMEHQLEELSAALEAGKTSA